MGIVSSKLRASANRRQAAKGEARVFLTETVFAYEGDECLTWPFAVSGRGKSAIKINGKMRTVARLVCEYAHGPSPSPNHDAAHSCGKGHEACVTKAHLSWKTRTENQHDRIAHGTAPSGEGNPNAKLTAAEVLAIRAIKGLSQRKIGRLFGISGATVNAIQNRTRWGHI